MDKSPRVGWPWKGCARDARRLYLQLFVTDYKVKVFGHAWVNIVHFGRELRTDMGGNVGATYSFVDISRNRSPRSTTLKLVELSFTAYNATQKHSGRICLRTKIYD